MTRSRQIPPRHREGFGPRSMMFALLRLFVFMLATGAAGVASAQQDSTFDHVSTGFPLTGAHELVRCETCHIKAIFKGTPRECAGCHVQNNQRAALAKPFDHIQTTAGCDTCHTVASFTGTRFNHVMAPAGTCASCHNGSRAQGKPIGHIATTLSCDSCHGVSGFAPVLRFDHSSLNGDFTTCASCHDGHTAVGPPSNHLPISNPALCGTCHVASTQNGFTTFGGGQMTHVGITSGCAACHGPSVTGTTFAGISSIVVMPATSPPSASSHIPSSTNCESCHLASVPAGPVAANAAHLAPGSAFATPAPTTAQIHSGISSGCSSCHEASFVWMGMSAYPISPTTVVANAQYVGFNTRPLAAASTFSVADAAHPTTGDCSQCHAGTAFFTGQTKPAGHIPTTVSSCSTCHVVSGDFSIAGLTSSLPTLHTGVTSGCISCHTSGAGAGPFAGCTTQASCSSPPPLSYQPKTPPLAAGGSPTAPSAATHIPVAGIACEKCHSPTGFTSFAGMNMKGNTPAHTAVGAATCESCHEYPYVWYGVTIRTPGSTNHHGRAAGQDCISSGCHNRSYTEFSTEARVRPVLRSAVNASNPRFLPGGMQLPGAGVGNAQAFDHQGVLPGQCQTCHNGQAARGLSARHFAVRSSCDSCHRTTAWSPAQFSHAGVPIGQCQSCHNGIAATSKPGGHFVTARSCDTCHRTIGWVPANYSHLSPLFRAQPDKTSCISCHVTNGELIPRQFRGGPRPRPIPGAAGS